MERRKKSPEQIQRELEEQEAIRAFVLDYVGQRIGPDKPTKPPVEGGHVCIEIEEADEDGVVRKIEIFQTTLFANFTISQPKWTISATTHDSAVTPARPSMELCRDGEPNLFDSEALAEARKLI